MADNLKLSEAIKGDVCVIKIAGEMDAHTSPAIKDHIEKKANTGIAKFVFDFAELSYISSAGIGVLNATLNIVKAKNGKMSIANANKAVWDTLDVMYFTKKVPIQKDIESAIKAVK